MKEIIGLWFIVLAICIVFSLGNCCGIVGGTSNTEYLSEGCIDCPHLCLIDKE